MVQQGIFVTGTDTDVGKTWVGQQLIRQLISSDMSVVPRKPVESGWQADNFIKTDAWKLATAASCANELDKVCPNRFKAAISPVRAAALEKQTLSLESVSQQCLADLQKDDFLYVEGAGGFFSPLVSDGLNADLAKALNLPVLLVAADRLGCINHILLTLAAIKSYGLHTVGIVLNQTGYSGGDSAMNNLKDLLVLTKVPVFQLRYDEKSISEELLELLR